MESALEKLLTKNVTSMPPLLNEEVLLDYQRHRLQDSDPHRLADEVSSIAALHGVKGNFKRNSILRICEEPLFNVLCYQRIRQELQDLRIHFRASLINGNRCCVTISNYLYAEDAELLACYLQNISQYDGSTVQSQIRSTLPNAKVDTQQGSGLGLMLLRRICSTFEYAFIPEGNFYNYILRISLMPNTNTKES